MNVQLVNVDGYGVNSSGDMNASRKCKRYGAKSSGGKTGRIRVDRMFVLGREGMGRRQAVVASKDQIQHFFHAYSKTFEGNSLKCSIARNFSKLKASFASRLMFSSNTLSDASKVAKT